LSGIGRLNFLLLLSCVHSLKQEAEVSSRSGNVDGTRERNRTQRSGEDGKKLLQKSYEEERKAVFEIYKKQREKNVGCGAVGFLMKIIEVQRGGSVRVGSRRMFRSS
jgi:hypothetical protein